MSRFFNNLKLAGQRAKIAEKILKEIGIDYSYGFMMITPWSLEQDIEDNIEILSTIGRIEFRSLFHEMTLIPGTKSFQMVQESDELSWCGSLSY